VSLDRCILLVKLHELEKARPIAISYLQYFEKAGSSTKIVSAALTILARIELERGNAEGWLEYAARILKEQEHLNINSDYDLRLIADLASMMQELCETGGRP
jgi:hypothetical protein